MPRQSKEFLTASALEIERAMRYQSNGKCSECSQQLGHAAKIKDSQSRCSPAVVVNTGCLRGFRSVRTAVATEMRHTVASTVIQPSVSLLSLWDHMISASHAAAHLPERFRKMYSPDLAYQEQPQGPLLVLT